MDKYLVVKDNELVKAKHKSLSIDCDKLLNIVISKLNSLQENLKTCVLFVSELQEELDGDKNFKSHIKKIVEELSKKVLFLPESKNKDKWYPWFASIEYDVLNEVYKFDFNLFLEKYLVSLNKNFTRVKLKYLLTNFSSRYTSRFLFFYFYAIGSKNFSVSIDDLKNVLGVDVKKYKNKDGTHNFGGFNKKILSKVKKDLCENIFKKDTILYKIIKDGKKIFGLKFIKASLKNGSKKNQQNKTSSESSEDKNTEYSELISLVPTQYKKGLEKSILKYFEKKGKKYVEEKILYTKEYKNVKSFIPFLKKALSEDYLCSKKNIKTNELIKEARTCFAKCLGNCPATWERYKNNSLNACYWCESFETKRDSD